MSIDRKEGERLTIHDPSAPPATRGDNEEAPAEGGSAQGPTDVSESSGGSRGPSGAEPPDPQA